MSQTNKRAPRFRLTWGQVAALAVTTASFGFGMIGFVVSLQDQTNWDRSEASVAAELGITACFFLIAIFFLIIALWLKPDHWYTGRTLNIGVPFSWYWVTIIASGIIAGQVLHHYHVLPF